MERDWKCWVRGLEEAGWVGFTAKSRGAARYKCWRAANDAGFDVRFGDIRVLRHNSAGFTSHDVIQMSFT